MSIVKMQKMSLVAHNSEKSRLLRIFLKKGCVELLKSSELKATPADKETKQKAESKLFRTVFALNFLKETAKELAVADKKNAPSVNLKKENRLISLEEYEEVSDNAEELFFKIDELEVINNRLTDIRNERTRLVALKEQLTPFSGLSIPFNKAKETDKTAV